VRSWLNSSFLNEAFDEYEKNIIEKSFILADRNPNFDTNPGNDTYDKIFLLGITETSEYLESKEFRRCFATVYAQNKGVYVSTTEGTCWYWLRTPSSYSSGSVFVDFYGNIRNDEMDFVRRDTDNMGVRPAMWIDLSELN
jgi:hypothetical protein